MNPGDTFRVNDPMSTSYQVGQCDYEITAPIAQYDAFSAYGEWNCNLPVKKEDGYILEGDEHKLYEILHE